MGSETCEMSSSVLGRRITVKSYLKLYTSRPSRLSFHNCFLVLSILASSFAFQVSIMSPSVNRPVKVAGASGGFSDRVRAISSLAKNEDVDVIVGDW